MEAFEPQTTRKVGRTILLSTSPRIPLTPVIIPVILAGRSTVSLLVVQNIGMLLHCILFRIHYIRYGMNTIISGKPVYCTLI